MLGQSMISPFPQRAGTAIRRRLLVGAAVFGAAFAAAGPAAADYGAAAVFKVTPSTVVVENDGLQYTAAEAGPPLGTEVEYVFNAQGAGKIRSFGVWLRIKAEGTDWIQFPQNKYSKTYPLGSRPASVHDIVPILLTLGDYSSIVASYCNQQADSLRSAGMTNQEIFSQNRPLEVAIDTALEYDMSGFSEADHGFLGFGYGGGEWSTATKFTVVCKKSSPLLTAPAEEEPTRTVPKVEFANLKVGGNDSNTGACSVGLIATIKTKDPNTEVKFRFESKDGQKSGIHTVVTPGNRLIQKGYEYPLSAGGTKTGQIRINIEGESKKSAWKDYEVKCGPAANDLQTLLPPKAKILAFEVDKHVVHQGMVCPTVITVHGVVGGRGKTSGTVTLGAGGNQIAEHPFSFENDETKHFFGKHQISWQGKPATQQDVPLTLRVHGQNQTDNEAAAPGSGSSGSGSLGPLQDALQSMVSLNCVEAEPAQIPLALSLTVTPIGEKLHEGFICPEQIVLGAWILGKEAYEGRAVLIATQQSSLSEPQSQVKEFNFSVAKDETLEQTFQPVVPWSNVKKNGDGSLKQEMKLSFKAVRNGATSASIEKSVVVNCKALNFPSVIVDVDPPKVLNLEIVPTTDEILHQGHICPARVELNGSFTGQGSASGRAVLIAGTRVKAMQNYDIEDGVTEVIRGEHEFNWEGVQGPFEQKVDFILRLDNAQGGEVDRLTETRTFDCRKPVVPGQGAAGSLSTGIPSVKSVSLSVAPVGEVAQNGYSCPAEALITGNVQNGPHALSGNVAFFVDGEQVKQEAVELAAHTGSGFAATRVLNWTSSSASSGQSGSILSGPAKTQQTIAFAMKVFSPTGEEIGKKLKMMKFYCSKIMSVGKVADSVVIPTPAKRVDDVAMPTNADVIILAPRDRVRNGQIRLSGAKPNQAFRLRFLRKTSGGSKPFNSAQLPGQMTGSMANFNLNALAGGDWKLEVCPLENGQVVSLLKCEHSDFYLPKGNSKKPGSLQPTGNGGSKTKRLFVAPGIGN